jgi:hypothetical protein
MIASGPLGPHAMPLGNRRTFNQRRSPFFSCFWERRQFRIERRWARRSQVNAKASQLEYNNAKPAAVRAKNPSDTKSCLRMIHLPLQRWSELIKNVRTNFILKS